VIGIVVRYDATRGWGFIRADVGPDIFVHADDALDDIWEGCMVRFTLGVARHRARAYAVHRLLEATP
jgi:cold shock CspA family protein